MQCHIGDRGVDNADFLKKKVIGRIQAGGVTDITQHPTVHKCAGRCIEDTIDYQPLVQVRIVKKGGGADVGAVGSIEEENVNAEAKIGTRKEDIVAIGGC